jgi:3-hydroxy-9,10-secoandrosta-1,3,5(10)-triene-9,17-dione monooxygenase reductase component
MKSDSIDPQHFRRVLSHFPTGVAVVTASGRGGPAGLTLQSFMSLSLSPAFILLSVDRNSTTWPTIAEQGRLAVNILAEEQSLLARQFARKGIDKFEGVDFRAGAVTGSPLLEGALAWIECSVERTYDGGDHLIVVCSVLDLDVDQSVGTHGSPLLFFKSGFPRISADEHQLTATA